MREPVTERAARTLATLAKLADDMQASLKDHPEGSYVRGFIEGEVGGLRAAYRYLMLEMVDIEIEAVWQADKIRDALARRYEQAITEVA